MDQSQRRLPYPGAVTAGTVEENRTNLTWPAPQWLSLFYDLAFAAGIIAIASSYGFDHSLLGAVWFATAYGIIASAWILTGGATGAFTARPRPVSTSVVALVVVQMATILMLAVASNDTIEASSIAFDELLAVLAATCLALGWLVRGASGAMPARSMWCIVFAIAMLAFAWILPNPIGLAVWWLALAALAFAAGLVAIDRHIDVPRLAHRLGELTIIIIGESLVKMVLTVGDESVWSVELVAVGAALVLLVATFWSYFTGPVKVVQLTGRRRLVWIAAHWSLHVGLLGLAVGLSKLLVDSKSLYAPDAVPALLTGPAILITASLAILAAVVGLGRWRITAIAAALVAAVAVVAALADIPPIVAAYGVGLVPLIAAGLVNRPRMRTETATGGTA
jgi:low temperature requirement protein LtrA